jgi:quinol monooxygenase YgiN
MIIITGELIAKAGCFEEALALSQQHVEHSRNEPGCISHNVFKDPENPHKLFFFEQWTDNDAIALHFVKASSQAFVKNMGTLTINAPKLSIFSAEKIR